MQLQGISIACLKFRGFVHHGTNMFDSLFFTDETWYGYINIQNSGMWSAENPHTLHENPLHSSDSGVWCAVSRKLIVVIAL
jgi:hypothetical protein